MSRPSGPPSRARCGLVVPDAGLEPFDLRGGDVGRVGDDRVEGPSPRTGPSRSPRRKSMRSATPCWAAFLRATARACFADVDRHEPGPGLAVRRGDRQAARAGADVHGADRLEGLGQCQEFDDDEFRLGAGDQHGRRDLERQGVELLAADEVGHRRALGPAADQVAEPAARAAPHLVGEVGVELHALPLEHVGQHDLRVEPRALRAPSLEVIGRPGQQPADGPRLVGPLLDAGLGDREVSIDGICCPVKRDQPGPMTNARDRSADQARSPSCSRRSCSIRAPVRGSRSPCMTWSRL